MVVAKPETLAHSEEKISSIYCKQVHCSSLFLKILKVRVLFPRRVQRAGMEVVAKLLGYGGN